MFVERLMFGEYLVYVEYLMFVESVVFAWHLMFVFYFCFILSFCLLFRICLIFNPVQYLSAITRSAPPRDLIGYMGVGPFYSGPGTHGFLLGFRIGAGS